MGKEKKLNLSKELLESMYKTMTQVQIANELGVSEKTIRRRFKEYAMKVGRHSIIVTNAMYKPKRKILRRYKSKVLFETKYKEVKSLVLVAKHFKISPDTALRWKQRHGIETIKGVSEYGKSLMNQNKPYTNKDWLKNAYSEYTIQEIADNLGVNKGTIQYWMKRHDIKTRTVAEQRAFKSGNGNRTIFSTYTNKFSKENYMKSIPRNLPHTIKAKIIEIVGKCQCCGYSEVLDLHHIDGNHYNNDPNNHLIICPNCHAKIHRLKMTLQEMCPCFISWFDMYV